ncbi:hypothetical protein D3C80_754480 [compost metagenome]
MATFFMVIGVLSWIVCSWTIGAAAGRYFGSRTAAWVYLVVSLVLSPLIGGICLFANHCWDYVEGRG